MYELVLERPRNAIQRAPGIVEHQLDSGLAGYFTASG